MRWNLNVLPMILMAASLPAFSAQPKDASPTATHRVQVFRTGKGEPRLRDAGVARTVSPASRPNQVQEKGRSRPYKVAKPGEGVPKG